MDLFIKYKTATNAYILEFLFYKKKNVLPDIYIHLIAVALT